MINRRHFLTTSLGALSVSTLPAIEPIQRPGASRMQLGVAAYSFRDSFQWSRDKEQKPQAGRAPWSILDFVDWCGDHGVAGAEVTSYFFPPDVDRAFLLELKRRAYLRGVQLAGTAVGNNFALPKGDKLNAEIAYTKKWIDHAAVMGAPHIRVFAGPQPKEITAGEAVANCQAAYQECLDYAAGQGVFLGLENHGGIVAEPDNLIQMVKSAKSPWAGINFDSGNFHTADPYADLAKIAPYAVNVQLKMEIKRAGGSGAEPSDVKRVLQILRDANYQGWFTLEYEMKADPFVEVPRILEMLKPLLA
ncbi:MAG: sugar phosphate isomerase/epimerase family protein [Verrucomicrobiota bacterium]